MKQLSDLTLRMTEEEILKSTHEVIAEQINFIGIKPYAEASVRGQLNRILKEVGREQYEEAIEKFNITDKLVIEEDDTIWEKLGSDDDYCFSRKVGSCKITIQWVDFMEDDYEKCWTLSASDSAGYRIGGNGAYINEKDYIDGFGRDDIEKVKEASIRYASACLAEHIKSIKEQHEKLLAMQDDFEKTQKLFPCSGAVLQNIDRATMGFAKKKENIGKE